MLKPIEIDKDFLRGANEPFPESVISIKPGKGSPKYIGWQTIADRLNKVTNGAWDLEIVRTWMEPVYYFDKNDNTYTQNGYSAHAHVRITVHMLDDNGNIISIKKEATGSHPLTNGPQQKDAFKAAASDAFKKACTYFGIGLQLYRDSSEEEYFNDMNFEDPWTDSALADHQEEWDFMTKAAEDYKLSEEAINGIVQQWGQGYSFIRQIPPDKFSAFIDFVRTLMGEGEEAV